MAHWTDAVVTNDGVEMLNEWMAGRSIKVTSAYGGSGTVTMDELMQQTQLVNPRQKLTLLGEEDGVDGKTIHVLVSNVDLMEEYELNQVGVFAKLDAEKNPDAPERLLFIMQDDRGVTVPPITENSFLLELYCMIGITNNPFGTGGVGGSSGAGGTGEPGGSSGSSGGRFEVSIDTAGVVTIKYLWEAIARAIQEHNNDPDAHQPIQDKINSVTTTYAGLDARLALLELMYTTEVSGNPFTVTFETLTGLVCTGVWNQALSRLEF